MAGIGSRIVNVAPRPSPRSRRPPCPRAARPGGARGPGRYPGPAGARARRLGLGEPVEDMRQEVGRDAAARVRDRDLHLGAVALQAGLDAAAAWRELDRVREQVPDHLLQTVGIARSRPHRSVQVRGEVDALGVERRAGRCRRRAVDGLARSTTRRLDPKLPGHDPGDVQEILDHAASACVCCARSPRERALEPPPVEGSRRSMLDPAEDGVQRRSELVGQRRRRTRPCSGRGSPASPAGRLLPLRARASARARPGGAR